MPVPDDACYSLLLCHIFLVYNETKQNTRYFRYNRSLSFAQFWKLV